MNISLDSKTVFMTGALGGIAEEVIKTLHGSGARMILTDKISRQEALPILGGYGIGHPAYYEMDVTEADQVDSVFERAHADCGPINVVLGHAGGTGVFPFGECSRERFDNLVALNFTGQTYLARAVLTAWRREQIAGHLIFTSSYVSRIPMEGISAYVASKAALEMFAKNLALEYAPHGIRVNCISPGNVAAGSSKLVYDNDEVYRAWVDRISPLGRRNSARGVANAFLFLCSELGDELDGHVLQVDQGVGLPKLG